MPGIKVNLYLINDRIALNQRYRAPLLRSIQAHGHTINNIGIFDSPVYSIFILLMMTASANKIIISSNLKSNILVLAFCSGPKLIILNGLGRFRASRLFRWILLRLISLRANAHIIPQNYADFRYLRRRCRRVTLTWVPGSGGSHKKIGEFNEYILVQRDSKIAKVSRSILKLLHAIPDVKELTIVGCNNESQIKKLFTEHKIALPGYVDSSSIFIYGGTFLQPEGYGEGFPHTLADAIMSDMNIYISDREFIRYGLYKLGATRQPLGCGWSSMKYGGETKASINEYSVTQCIMNILQDELSNTGPCE